MEDGYYNKQAFILVHSKQNSGKTTFCRFLCPPALTNYLAENISDDKDSKIAIAKNFLINLDELSSLAKHEINSLKALFSKDIINERLPYDRKNSIIHRVASFVGSTNMAEFLTDETGSVRWLCFEIKSIDWGYKRAVEINQVWAQAYYTYKEGRFDAEMTADDIAQNEARNSKFQQLSTEAELIPKYLKPCEPKDLQSEFMTATDVIVYMGSFTSIKLNKIMIGRAMPVCGFRRLKDSITDRYGYFAIKLK
jgi:predicted P-loop ATPase